MAFCNFDLYQTIKKKIAYTIYIQYKMYKMSWQVGHQLYGTRTEDPTQVYALYVGCSSVLGTMHYTVADPDDHNLKA